MERESGEGVGVSEEVTQPNTSMSASEYYYGCESNISAAQSNIISIAQSNDVSMAQSNIITRKGLGHGKIRSSFPLLVNRFGVGF